MHFFKIDELPGTQMLPGMKRRAVWLDEVMLTFFSFEPGVIVPEHKYCPLQRLSSSGFST